MEENEDENDNRKVIELTDEDFKNYLSSKFDKTEIPVKTIEDQDTKTYLDKKFPK
jgi:hypothetical protein